MAKVTPETLTDEMIREYRVWAERQERIATEALVRPPPHRGPYGMKMRARRAECRSLICDAINAINARNTGAKT